MWHGPSEEGDESLCWSKWQAVVFTKFPNDRDISWTTINQIRLTTE